jgi:uncharacterized protein YhbP (UPF0306 family)
MWVIFDHLSLATITLASDSCRHSEVALTAAGSVASGSAIQRPLVARR